MTHLLDTNITRVSPFRAPITATGELGRASRLLPRRG